MTNTISRWLFREGGQYNIALARMAIAAALGLSLWYHGNFTKLLVDYDTWVEGASASGWSPKGLIKIVDLFTHGPPEAWFGATVFIVSVVSIAMMFIGLLVPWSQIVAAISTTLLISLETSFGPYWSHAYNVQLLTALAFMFGASADVWSVDALIRRLRRKSRPERGPVYWWPVIFAELATALFMFGAFVQKFRDTGIYWALSDNIRNSLAVTWFQYRSDPPPIAQWLMENPTFAQMAGAGQLITQATTILACFLLARPIFRVIAGGGFFLLDILALGYVFRFWHPFWVPLCLLSVDWEYFARQFKARWARGKASVSQPAKTLPTRTIRSVVYGFGALFFGYYVLTLAFRWGETHLNYPFSTMGFYSETRAIPPYSTPSYFPIYTGRADLYEVGHTEPIQLWYREGALEDMLFRLTTIEELRALDVSFRSRANSNGLYVAQGVTRVPTIDRIEYSGGLMAVTPAPQPVDLARIHMPLRAVSDQNGFRALVTHLDFDEARGQYFITIEHTGFTAPTFRMMTRYNVREEPRPSTPTPLDGTWEGERFFIQRTPNNDGKYLYTMVEVTDSSLEHPELYAGPDNIQSYR